MVLSKNKTIVFLLLTFLFISLLIHISSIDQLDKDISLKFYDLFNNNFVTQFFSFITSYALVVSLISLGTLIYIKSKNIYQLILFLVLTLTQSLIVSAAQILIQRPRPFTNNETIVYLGNNIPIAFSFPSSHSSFAFFLAYLACNLLNLKKRERTLVYIIAFLIAFSRIYLGAHYILDVTGGAILGTVLGMISLKVYYKIIYKYLISTK